MSVQQIIQAWSDANKAGWIRIPEIISYAAKENLPLPVACTALEKESNTRNVFGHDAVETGGRYVKGEPVTREKYLAYKTWRDEPARRQADLPSRMQGVGPMQLTWWKYQDIADERGGCDVWEVNLDYGFEVFADHIKNFNGDIWQAAKAYNGKASYADDFVSKHRAWTTRLAGATQETQVSNKNSSSRGGTPISLIAVHTNEGPNDSTASPDPGAENLIVWMENNGVSYHVVVDDDSRPRQVTDDRASWSLRTGNARSLNVCFIGRAAFTRAEWLRHDRMLHLGADQVREWCDRYGIPKVKLPPAQVGANQWGVCGHWDWTVGKSDGSHTDPGSGFPWDVFMSLVNGGSTPEPTPIVTSSEDCMSEMTFRPVPGEPRQLRGTLAVESSAGMMSKGGWVSLAASWAGVQVHEFHEIADDGAVLVAVKGFRVEANRKWNKKIEPGCGLVTCVVEPDVIRYAEDGIQKEMQHEDYSLTVFVQSK